MDRQRDAGEVLGALADDRRRGGPDGGAARCRVGGEDPVTGLHLLDRLADSRASSRTSRATLFTARFNCDPLGRAFAAARIAAWTAIRAAMPTRIGKNSPEGSEKAGAEYVRP
ncbi:hypothetical protein ACIQVL_21810 [Streptomyces sp. NPDC090499]|uniref:hypothetical protein n=1 Tax=unclassified Streptomyces TaxID=2593676 RepID=UPI0038097467